MREKAAGKKKEEYNDKIKNKREEEIIRFVQLGLEKSPTLMIQQKTTYRTERCLTYHQP